jgi:hypothetical protein
MSNFATRSRRCVNVSIQNGNYGNYGNLVIYQSLSCYRRRSNTALVTGSAGSETVDRLVKQRENVSHSGPLDKP